MIEDSSLSQDAAVLEANHGDEEADAGCEGELQRGGYHVKDDLPDIAQTEQDEENALDEYGSQGKAPRVTQ